MRLIPGHFRAFDFWLMILWVVAAYLMTYSLTVALGIILMVVGAFLGSQATHLAQEDHSAPPPTKIERYMQHHRWPSLIGGFLISLIGVVIAFV